MYEELRARGEKALHDAMLAYASTEIANLFSAFTFYVRGAREDLAFQRLWSRREDIAYVASGKGYRGQEAVRAYFADRPAALRREKLPRMAALFPEKIRNEDKYLGAGDYEMHALTTPHIRVAGDLQTAKGVWWSPGIVAEAAEDGGVRAYVRTVQYGCDFILEADAWKIWHLREFAEFSYPFDGEKIDMTGKENVYGAGAELSRRISAGAPAPDVVRETAGPYTRTRVPAMVPDLLPNYDTWDDSLSCIRDESEVIPWNR